MDDGSSRDRAADERALDDGIIGRLVHKYCDAVCTDDVDTWIDTWSDDAVWEIGRGPVSGRDAIRGAFERATGLFDSVNQITYNGAAELDHDAGTGSGRWYMGEFGRSASGINLFYLGFYDDTYVRDDTGEWRFASRTLNWLYQGPPDLSGGFGPPTGYYAR